MTQSKVSICNLYPDLLGTYGDTGNARVLSMRLGWRNIAHEIVEVTTGRTVPTTCDIYLLGGGEDQPQTSVADQLIASKALNKAVQNGASVLAICAGMQVIGETFAVPGGERAGAAVVDMKSVRNEDPRYVGELAVEPDSEIATKTLSGYENHGSATLLGSSARPLGRVISGHGNGAQTSIDGAIQGRVVCTYMHGPVLARNAELADRLLQWATGGPLTALDDSESEELRRHRLTGDQGPSEAKHLARRFMRSVQRRVR